jgi:hypothetical protein
MYKICFLIKKIYIFYNAVGKYIDDDEGFSFLWLGRVRKLDM